VSISVSFYHVAPESHVNLNCCCPVVLQLVWQCVFDLYWNCKEHKHFKFSNFRYRRRSLFKSISVTVGVAISLHHQFMWNTTKSAQWNAALCFFPLGQKGGGHCKFAGCWVCWSGPLCSSCSDSCGHRNMLCSRSARMDMPTLSAGWVELLHSPPLHLKVWYINGCREKMIEGLRDSFFNC